MKRVFLFLLIFTCFSIGSTFAIDKIEINTASLAQLETLTGIGPVKAQAIIDARPFSSVDDLDRAKGIGPATLQGIKDQGLACVNCQTPQAPTTPENPAPVNNTTPEKTLAPEPITYPSGIFINEILPNPAGADETEEWFEIFNSNNFDVALSNWQIKDTVGTVITFNLPKDTKILASGFLVFKRPETKIMLNNDEDGLILYSPDEKITDTISFTKAPLGQSYNKTTSGSWTWSTTLTPEFKNIIPIIKTSSADSGPNGLSNTKNSVKNDGVALQLADLSQAIDKSQTKSPWFLFITVLATTIFLATLVLLIKFRIRSSG